MLRERVVGWDWVDLLMIGNGLGLSAESDGALRVYTG